jgi:hypothetical protein
MQTISLSGATPGTTQTLTVLRFGTPGARPQVYIQSSLHADEIPGMICAHHLRVLLAALNEQGRILGEVVLVPVANPLGLTQTIHGHNLGRFALADGGNFNRDFADLAEAAAAKLEGRLSANPAKNVDVVREALAEAHAERAPVTSAEHLKHALLGLSLGADYVLDLHCDGEAVMHFYTMPASVEPFAALTRLMEARAILLAETSGGGPFDEAVSGPWIDLAARFSDHPILQGCHSTTVELRGQGDVSHEFAAADAEALIGFMIHAGAIEGEAPVLPQAVCEPTPLVHCEPVIAPTAGMLVYAAALGTTVSAGDMICEIIEPLTGGVTPVLAQSSGVLFARAGRRFVTPGQRLGKIAGRTFERSGNLLSP